MEINVKNVRLIRLGNDDDVISEYVEEGEFYRLINPMNLIIEADIQNQKQNIYMYSWLPQGVIKDKTALVRKDIVICICELEEDIVEHYCGAVFDINDSPRQKVESKKKIEHLDNDKKVISFNNKNKDLN
jgi:hypothetical protein